ncbi:protein kinase domain-containing protein [Streptomyces prunicolor]|uniref:protein kinase domain-containing protein n=1 Tax=Streptomyces prunicolor TaxID=67348 RepID=UPI003428B88D
MEGSSGLTRTGDIVGSPDYLAPERAMGHRPGPESDLWSLGVTLYAAVEGRSPFLHTTTMSTLQAVIAEELPEPRHAGPLAPVIEALLRKDPNERPTAEQALRMLSAVAAGLPMESAAPEAAEHPPTQVAPPTDDNGGGRFVRAPTRETPPTPVPSHGSVDRTESGPAAHAQGRAPTAPTAPVPFAQHDDGAGTATRRRRKSLMIAGAALAVALAGGGAAAMVMTSDSHGTYQSAPAASRSTARPAARTPSSRRGGQDCRTGPDGDQHPDGDEGAAGHGDDYGHPAGGYCSEGPRHIMRLHQQPSNDQERLVRRGSAAVRQAQCYLNLSMTGDTIPEDGNFGPVTEVATRRFQTCANITVDGLIGPETWSYLICWASSPNYLC